MYDYTIEIEERIGSGGFSINYQAFDNGVLLLGSEIPNDLFREIGRLSRKHRDKLKAA